jgi:hypothetical protein
VIWRSLLRRAPETGLDRPKGARMTKDDIEQDGDGVLPEDAEQDDDRHTRRSAPKLGIGYDELRLLIKSIVRTAQDRSPLGQDLPERIVEGVFRLLNRREVVQRILRSEFMASVREMQSEITESVGIASQSDVQEIKSRLDDVVQRLDKLQGTLDEIVVEVEGA